MSERDNEFFVDDGTEKRGRGCLLFVVLFICLLLLIGYFNFRQFIDPERQAQKVPERAGKISFWILGGDETFGSGAGEAYAWPNKIKTFFAQKYPKVDLILKQSGITGANTSEAKGIISDYLEKISGKEQGVGKFFEDDIIPDFAFISYGSNNYWNLHGGTFLVKNIPGEDSLAKAMELMEAEDIRGLVTISRDDYYDYKIANRDEKFFEGFDDQFLSKWIKSDIEEIIELLKSKGIRPILLTYYDGDFAKLNQVIRELGTELGVQVIEIENSRDFYAENELATLEEEYLRLNEKGGELVAENIINAFSKAHSNDEIEKIASKNR